MFCIALLLWCEKWIYNHDSALSRLLVQLCLVFWREMFLFLKYFPLYYDSLSFSFIEFVINTNDLKRLNKIATQSQEPNTNTSYSIRSCLIDSSNIEIIYRAFHRFGQAKIARSGLVLDSSQFSLLPQLPQKMTLPLKVVKIDSKKVILLHKSKSVTPSVVFDLT